MRCSIDGLCIRLTRESAPHVIRFSQTWTPLAMAQMRAHPAIFPGLTQVRSRKRADVPVGVPAIGKAGKNPEQNLVSRNWHLRRIPG
jgi:hypothetical protein